MSIKVFKYRLTFFKTFVGFYYEPNGTDKKEPNLLARKIFSIRYGRPEKNSL